MRGLERSGLIEYEYAKTGGRGRRKKTAGLTKAGLDLLRLSRILEAEKPPSSTDLTLYYRLMGLDPLEAVSSLEKYYLTGLLAFLDRALDFIPKVEIVTLIVDPSEIVRVERIAGWFSDNYRFILRPQPLDSSDSLYEVKEMGCLERAGTVRVKIATLERALTDAVADFEADPGAALQATYILLEDRYIDYEKLKEFAEECGGSTPSRIGYIFNYANQAFYTDPERRFPETFPSGAAGEDAPFTRMVMGAAARVFSLP